MEKVVLITGCSSGIGRALALELHSRGWRVWATAPDPERMGELRELGLRVERLDVTEDAEIHAVVERLLAEAGRVDALVNNAGLGVMGPLADLPREALVRQFEVNVFGAMALARAVAPAMIAARRGVIVNVGSVSGVFTTPFAGAYCASKAALHSLSDALRMELAPFGVDVVTARLGAVRSAFADEAEASVDRATPGTSPYAPLREALRRRAAESRHTSTTPERAARAIAKAIEKRRRPTTLRLGRRAFLLPLLKRLLPTRLLDRILMRRYGLAELGRRDPSK